MLGFRCSSWEVAGGYFFTQHAVKPCNSFPQTTVGTNSVVCSATLVQEIVTKGSYPCRYQLQSGRSPSCGLQAY